jgi:hypothetical protein
MMGNLVYQIPFVLGPPTPINVETIRAYGVGSLDWFDDSAAMPACMWNSPLDVTI